jgi:hypothetical protein
LTKHIALRTTMRKLSDWYYRIASGKTLLLGSILYLVFPTVVLKNLEEQMNTYAGRQIGPIDLLFFETNPEQVLEMVAAYGEQGRAQYALGELTADVAYPLAYAFLFGVILSLLFRGKRYVPFRYINLIPVLMLGFDLLENTCIVMLLKSYPAQSVGMAGLCLVFNSLKWITFLLMLSLILYGLGRRVLQKFTTISS